MRRLEEASQSSGQVLSNCSARSQRSTPRSTRRLERFHDAAVSGSDAIEDRPGFAALLDRIENNGVRTVIIEDVSRFAREMKAHILAAEELPGVDTR
jgi:DNA invertase Pin-like site-specific DNA recombinase